jgi:hypothetical protein
VRIRGADVAPGVRLTREREHPSRRVEEDSRQGFSHESRRRMPVPMAPIRFAKIPGLGTTFKMLTKVWPLGRGTVSVSDNDIVVE